jgi:hypothetical protein
MKSELHQCMELRWKKKILVIHRGKGEIEIMAVVAIFR